MDNLYYPQVPYRGDCIAEPVMGVRKQVGGYYTTLVNLAINLKPVMI
jgi:hypothetical protein